MAWSCWRLDRNLLRIRSRHPEWCILVPQVARALQTAPVVPPGAFPDGEETDAQDTSVIPGWSILLSGQQSAATLAEWPAKQKAREEEAAAALLRQCQAEGGCGAGGEAAEAPLEGSTELEGSCTGSGACAASKIKCRVTFVFVAFAPYELGFGGLVSCDKTMGAVEISMCLYEQNGGKYDLMHNGCQKNPEYKTDEAQHGNDYRKLQRREKV